jgi:NodT family efflux transporter outer membrane factor (OMF) lipoprotein
MFLLVKTMGYVFSPQIGALCASHSRSEPAAYQPVRDDETFRGPLSVHNILCRWTARLMTIGALVPALLSGCAGSGSAPAHEPPVVPEKAGWSAPLGEQRQIDRQWWKGFGDPYLDQLTDRAIAGNVNLQVMAARTDVAAAQIGQAKAALLPVISAGARSDTTTISGDYDLGTSSKTGVGSDMLWELDIWGKARKGVQAQKAAYRASAAEQQAGYLALVSQVASTYFLIRQTDDQIVQQEIALERSRTLHDIYQDLYENDLESETTVLRQRVEVTRAESALETLRTSRKKLVNGLATLVGVPAGELDVPDTSGFADIAEIRVPAGLPSELLTRRPDIIAARERLSQSIASEGQARLAQLPSVGLTGLGGSASYGLSNLLTTWTAGLSGVIQFPVFDPNVRARIPVSEAEVEVAEQHYRATVMAAFEEVENVLVALDGARKQHALLGKARADLATVTRQQMEQLRLGLVSQLQVIEAERDLQEAEQLLLANHWQILSDTVSLFKAVGGGWPGGDSDS